MSLRFFAKLVVLVLALLGSFLSSVYGAISASNREIYLQNFEAGEEAFGQRQFDKAVQHFTNALSINPEQIRPRFRLAQALQALGRNEESVNHFAVILEKHPNNIAARIGLAQGLIALGRTSEARQQLAWILQVQPEHTEAKNLMAAIGSASSSSATIFASHEDGRENIPAGFQPLPMRPCLFVDDNGSSQFTNNNSLKVSNKKNSYNSKSESDSNSDSNFENKCDNRKIPVPPKAMEVSTWKVSDFLERTKGSFTISLEYAKYCLEKGDLEKAAESLKAAEVAALESRDTRRFLESQIYRSLLNLYRLDIRGFGQQLLKLKPLLSKETYSSFLEVYNRAQNASNSADVTRLVGGVALGAEHYAVAARLFGKLLEQMPGDIFLARMLAEAQMGMHDYNAAERTLIWIMQKNPNSGEAAMNLAKFYLTARFDQISAEKYLELANRLNPGDPRIEVMRALLLCTQGKIREGREALKYGLEKANDPQIRFLAERVLAECDRAERNGGRIDVVALLALPGSRGDRVEALKTIGENYLKRGSFFMALRYFHDARDLAEIGRSYLALSSHLFALGDSDNSALAAGFGLRALYEELKKNPQSARAKLYLALYHFERREYSQARRLVEAGLSVQAETSTRRHLRALYNKLSS